MRSLKSSPVTEFKQMALLMKISVGCQVLSSEDPENQQNFLAMCPMSLAEVWGTPTDWDYGFRSENQYVGVKVMICYCGTRHGIAVQSESWYAPRRKFVMVYYHRWKTSRQINGIMYVLFLRRKKYLVIEVHHMQVTVIDTSMDRFSREIRTTHHYFQLTLGPRRGLLAYNKVSHHPKDIVHKDPE